MRAEAAGRFLIIFAACFLWYAPLSAAQVQDLPGAHRGAVTALLRDGYGNILSAGEDGFVGLWNGLAAEDRHQISRDEIRSFVLRPGSPQIAVVERAGIDLYRVAVWDYLTRENLFTLPLHDPVLFINYSAAGSYLILARGGARAGLVLLHPETGAELPFPQTLSGPVAFAATGGGERIMISYRASGLLSYWDLESGEELHQFEVPPAIDSPILFGNNRFFGGFDSQGLLVIDAATGFVLARNTSIRQGIVFAGDSGSADARGFIQFYSLVSGAGGSALYRMEINLNGNLNILSRRNIPAAAGRITSAISGDAGRVILGTSAGGLWVLDGQNARAMTAGNARRILYAAASASSIAFLCESGVWGYIPLDFSLIDNGVPLTLQQADASAHILSSVESGAGDSSFLFWQPGAVRFMPQIVTFTNSAGSPAVSWRTLDQVPVHFPLRAADIMGGSVLFLNTSGGLTVLDKESGDVRFSHTVAGSVDAAFVDEDTVIFARSAIGGNTPFLMISISTGETVLLAYPAVVGTRIYRASSGALYGAVVEQTGDSLRTSLIRLNTTAPLQSPRLAQYPGEDPYFTLAESGGNLAFALGRGQATLYRNEGKVALERGRGLPVQILNGGRWFVVLDGDGGITWHDNDSGNLLASFRLHQESWSLQRNGETIGGGTAAETQLANPR